MITREQVADLRPGDVVELVDARFPDVVTRGPLHEDDEALYLGNFRAVRWDDGSVPASGSRCTLTVISRAPRLYVNHDREKPVLGDVVRDANGVVRHAMKPPAFGSYDGDLPRWWGSIPEHDGEWLHCSTEYMARPLTLILDGETGQVVP